MTSIRSKGASAVVLAICCLTLLGCARNQAPNLAGEEAEVRQLDRQWVQAAATHNADEWMKFYADDAVVLPQNEPTAANKESIRKSLAGLLSTPNLQLTWTPTQVVVANSGDMAYLYGTYKLTATDQKGAPIAEAGKIVEIWKKRSDRNWKCVLDAWSSDAAIPAS